MNYFSRPAVEYTVKTHEQIISKICMSYGISEKQLKSKSRLRHLVDARGIAMYILNKKMNYNTLMIGKLLNRNHATIIHQVRKIEGLIEVDKLFKETVNEFI